MARKQTFANWAGIGAAALLAATATGFAVAADPTPPPAPPDVHVAGHGPQHGPGMMMPGLGPAMMLEHMADRLGLSPEQRESLHKALAEARPGFEALHEQMRHDIERLARTRPDDPGYQALVASASQSASQTAAQMVLQASQLRSRVYGVLTPAQREQAAKLEADHLARLHERERGERDGHHGHEPMQGGPDVPPPPPPR